MSNPYPFPDARPREAALAAALAEIAAILDRHPELAARLRTELDRRAPAAPPRRWFDRWRGRRADPAPPPAALDQAIDARIAAALAPLLPEGRPNYHPLRLALRDVDLMKLGIKALGQELAARLAASRPNGPPPAPPAEGLPWKLALQRDMASDWYRHWCAALGHRPLLNRGPWQHAYILQVLHAAGLLVPGRRGLGFGCGTEPMPSYFASLGLEVVGTDMPPEHPDKAAWAPTAQTVDGLAQMHRPELVDKAAFERRVRFEHVDMNAIPPHLAGFDFCWSVCAMEHLGSIERAMRFVTASLATLRPGGIAVHTTEFNCNATGPTTDHVIIVLPQRRHFEALAEGMRAAGHDTGALDFDPGDGAFDRFVDLPPYLHDMDAAMQLQWRSDIHHIRLAVDGFPSTAFGLWVKKGGG